MAKRAKPDPELLACQALLHWWEKCAVPPYLRNGVFGRKGQTGLRRAEVCVRCGSDRIRLVAKHGRGGQEVEVGKPQIFPSERYKQHKKDWPLTRAEAQAIYYA